MKLSDIDRIEIEGNTVTVFNKQDEAIIGYSIIKGFFLKDLECKFEKMRRLGVEATEHIPFQKFWADANKILKIPIWLSYSCNKHI